MTSDSMKNRTLMETTGKSRITFDTNKKEFQTVNHTSQLRQYLTASKEDFSNNGYKAFVHAQGKKSREEIAKIAIEEGFNPVIIHSQKEFNKTLDKEQFRVRENLLSRGLISDPYNLLIANLSNSEEWVLNDDRVKLVLINSLDFTEDRLERINGHIPLLIFKTEETVELALIDEIPKKYLNRTLTKVERDILCLELKIFNSNGTPAKWGVILKLIDKDPRYVLKNSTKLIDGKRTRVVTIMVA